MSQGPRPADPSLPEDASQSLAEGFASSEDSALAETAEPDNADDADADDSFDEFESYAKLAAGARIKGAPKSSDAMKMRGNRDAGAGRKLNKPTHKDKRGP